jgi:hypothetical protein
MPSAPQTDANPELGRNQRTIIRIGFDVLPEVRDMDAEVLPMLLRLRPQASRWL